MAGSTQENGAIAGINVTPMVDILLVLLVIVFVTAQMTANEGVELDLPQAVTAGEVQVVLSVVVPKDGPLQVNGAQLPDDDALLEQTRAQIAEHRDLSVLIAADGGTPHRRVLKVMDLLRQAGAQKIAFAAEPLESKP